MTIDKAFKNYNANKKTLRNYPLPTLSGVDYSKPAVKGDKTKNGNEQMILSALNKKSELENLVELVDKTLAWFEVEGYGRERYIQLRLINRSSEVSSCLTIGISERTGRNWRRDIFEKAEIYAEKIGIF